MSISKNIPGATVVDYATGIPKPDSELIANKNARQVAIGNAPASSIKVGNYLMGENLETSQPSYRKVLDISTTSEVPCKLVTFESGLVLKVAAESSLNVGDTVSGAYGINHVIVSIDDTDPATTYTFTLEGEGNFNVSGILVS